MFCEHPCVFKIFLIRMLMGIDMKLFKPLQGFLITAAFKASFQCSKPIFIEQMLWCTQSPTQ